MKIRFCGAAGTVTGSCHLLEMAGRRVLVDCGLFQGSAELDGRNRTALPFDPAALDAVVVTHAHTDHIGRLPLLVQGGFRGPIVSTRATAELTAVSLLDSASIQERHRERPLFGAADVEATWARFEHKVAPGARLQLFDDLAVTLHPAGHIFGSTSPLFEFEEAGSPRRVLVSGDIGRPDTPILRDPDPPSAVDVLVIESTYGDRDHKSIPDTGEELFEAIEQADADGGNILIPAFALGRAQELLYYLNDYAEAGLLDRFTIYLDSPLAGRFLEVFRQNRDLYDEDARFLLEAGDDPFRFDNLRITIGGRDSREIDEIDDGAIIIASGGMCEGGRIVRHLARLVERPETDVLFLGYQAEGTLGRRLVEGAREVEIDGRMRSVACHIRTLGGFSGHAGRRELLAWARTAATSDTRAFCVHGEPRCCRALAAAISEETGATTHVPDHLETVEI